MQFDKFTMKSQEALQEAQKLAQTKGHQQIEPEHLLYVLLNQPEGVVPSVLKKMGVQLQAVIADTEDALNKLPKVSGAGVQIYLSQALNQILEKAFTIADEMKDEYVSQEHIILAILDFPETKAAQALTTRGVTRESFLQALMGIRGSQRITDPNP